MRILALDLATKTGFAHTDGTSGLNQFNWAGVPFGLRWLAYQMWLVEFLDEHPTDAVVYEASLHQKGNAAKVANGMVTLTEMIAVDREMKIKGYHNMTLKKHATGSGRADKTAMWEAAKARGITWTPESDDVIDALWLLDLALNDGEL